MPNYHSNNRESLGDLGDPLPSDERVALVVLTQTISADHARISSTLDRMADALEGLEAAQSNGFWTKFGEALIHGMEAAGHIVGDGTSTFCKAVGGHRVAVVLLVIIPVLWIAAATGTSITIPGGWHIGTAPPNSANTPVVP